MIDTHAHLTHERFADDLAEVVGRAAEQGIEAIVTLGTDEADSRAAAALASLYPTVFAAVGIHPHSAESATEDALSAIRALAADGRVVAIGETGLDYHYDFAPRDRQRATFAAQLRLASECDLPIVVHSRNSDADVMEMIREHASDVRGVLHSFSGGLPLLEAALDAGWLISFAGMITFKNYDGADLVWSVPYDRFLVETDSPYLTPTPHRGKRNEPAYVNLVADRAAELRGVSVDEFRAQCALNARRFFWDPGCLIR